MLVLLGDSKGQCLGSQQALWRSCILGYPLDGMQASLRLSRPKGGVQQCLLNLEKLVQMASMCECRRM